MDDRSPLDDRIDRMEAELELLRRRLQSAEESVRRLDEELRRLYEEELPAAPP